MLFVFTEASSQSLSLTSGARALAMGNASACLKDSWSLFNNVAGLSGVTDATTSFTYYSLPGFKLFDRTAATFVMPFSFGSAAVGVHRFGSELYNEQIASVGFANRFGIASLGIRVNYIQYNIEGFGRTDAFTVSFGGITQLTKQIQIGAHITNINQPTISDVAKETVPTYLTLGLGFTISEKVFVTPEVSKDLEHDLLFRAGIEYKAYKKVAFRTGVNLHPQAVYGGLGFHIKKFTLDFATQYHEQLGFGHQGSVSWKFKKQK